MIRNFKIKEPTTLAKLIYKHGLDDMEMGEGGWLLQVSKHRKMRSVSQNKMYWAILTEIAVETGNDKDDLHEYFKALSATKTMKLSKTSVQVPVSTKEMDTKQFSDYVERIIQFCDKNMGIKITSPSEQNDEYYRELDERFETVLSHGYT